MMTFETRETVAAGRGPESPLGQGDEPVRSKGLAVYIGRSAGSELYHHILTAKRRVVAVAPYIKPLFARKLVEAAARGVHVTLVTSEDAERRREVAATLVEQVRHTNHTRRRWRRLGLIVSSLLLLSCVPLCLTVPGWSHAAPLYALWPMILGLLGIAGFRLLRVHSYTYRFRLPTVRVIASPYRQPITSEGSPLTIHAKVYVIDDEVAYLGSLNLTPEAFFDNFECCVRVEDPTTVRKATGDIEALIADQSLRILDAATVGRGLYTEPRA